MPSRWSIPSDPFLSYGEPYPLQMSDAGKLPVAKTYQPKERYLSLQRDSLRDPESFWANIAGQLVWHKRWDKVLKWDPPFAQWFVGGLLNASENAVDRHVKS